MSTGCAMVCAVTVLVAKLAGVASFAFKQSSLLRNRWNRPCFCVGSGCGFKLSTWCSWVMSTCLPSGNSNQPNEMKRACAYRARYETSRGCCPRAVFFKRHLVCEAIG
ncbi:hypothetical protein C8F01DRAFT_1169579 [Mycena amicta]|nr:hypothetical protein C8F01DRAFT_1169579 [Mycena amicta]